MRRLICATIFLPLLIANLAIAGPKYVIKDLGVLPGDKGSKADAINNKGEIVGTSGVTKYAADGRPSGSRAFLWRDGRMSEIVLPGEEPVPLNTNINDSGQIIVSTYDQSFIVQGDMVKRMEGLPGYPSVTAMNINNRTDVVGRCTDSRSNERPFCRRNGIMSALPMPPKCNYVNLITLNQKGVAIGSVEEHVHRSRNVLWENGKLRVLTELADSFTVTSISDDDTIIGNRLGERPARAFLMRKGIITYLKLPTGMGASSVSCMNGKGVLAGRGVVGKSQLRAVVWDAKGNPTDLGTLGGPESEACDINDSGVIVGVAQDEKGISHAVMWTPVK